MSKKDRQRHDQKQEPITLGGVTFVADESMPPGTAELRGANGTMARVENIQPLTPQLMNQPEAPSETDSREAELIALRASLREFQELSASRAAEVLGLKSDLDLLSKAARHGAPPDGFEPKTAEGKEALEQVVLLGNIAKDQRERATDADAKWVRAVEDRDRLATRVQVLEDASAAPPMPEGGWASNTARQLVEAVPPHDRVLLLGDLLAQLLPHTGEQGQNETASDVLKRKLAELKAEEDLCARTRKAARQLEEQVHGQSERMVKIQSAMVARRAPDAEAGALLEALGVGLTAVAKDMGITSNVSLQILPIFDRLAREWRGLHAFLSAAPLVAVAVRDDGAKGPVRERFSLLVLSWDGKAVTTTAIESVRPWGDISPYLDGAVRKHLIPAAYR